MAKNDDAENAMRKARIVIQEHHARTHNLDFRLENDAVFKCWAMPKVLPDRIAAKQLAIRVKEPNLEYGDL